MPGHDLPTFLLTLVALLVLTSVRTCRETERVAIHAPQGFVRLFGPGIYMRWPWQLRASQHTRVQLGEGGEYAGDGWGWINGARMPVSSAQALKPGDAFRIEAFHEGRLEVASDPGRQDPASP